MRFRKGLFSNEVELNMEEFTQLFFYIPPVIAAPFIYKYLGLKLKPVKKGKKNASVSRT